MSSFSCLGTWGNSWKLIFGQLFGMSNIGTIHHIFGVRHHGPGSARALLQALNALEPDIMLIEGAT